MLREATGGDTDPLRARSGLGLGRAVAGLRSCYTRPGSRQVADGLAAMKQGSGWLPLGTTGRLTAGVLVSIVALVSAGRG